MSLSSLINQKIVIVPSRQGGIEFRRSLVHKGWYLPNFQTETLFGLAENKALAELFYEGYFLIDEQVGREIMLEVLLSLEKDNKLNYFNKISADPQTAKTFYKAILEAKLFCKTNKNISFENLDKIEKIEDQQKEDDCKANEGAKSEDLERIFNKYNDFLINKKYIDRADALKIAIEKEQENQINNKEVQSGTEDIIYFVPENLKLYPLEEEWLDVLTEEKNSSKVEFSLKDPEVILNKCISSTKEVKEDRRELNWKIINGYGENNEVRQMVREIKDNNIKLDECVFCCTDYKTYSKLLNDLSQEYNLPMTFSHGVNIMSTAPGKLTKAVLSWYQNGFKTSDFREIVFGNQFAIGKLKKYFEQKVEEKLQEKHEELYNELKQIEKESDNNNENENSCANNKEEKDTSDKENHIKEKDKAGKGEVSIVNKYLSVNKFYEISHDLLPGLNTEENKDKFDRRKEFAIEEFEEKKKELIKLDEDIKEKERRKQYKNLWRELCNITLAELFFLQLTGENADRKSSLSKGLFWLLNEFLLLRYPDKEETDPNIIMLQNNAISQDNQAKKALIEILERLIENNFSNDNTTAILLDFIENVKVFPSTTRPGHIHVTDINNGIWIWRENIFLVGMDANRFPGTSLEDPILLDEEREVLLEKDVNDDKWWHLFKNNRFRIIYENMNLFKQIHFKKAGSLYISYSNFSHYDFRPTLPASILLTTYKELANKKDELITVNDFVDYFSRKDNRLVKAGFNPNSKNSSLDQTEFWLYHTDGGNNKLQKISTFSDDLIKADKVLQERRSKKQTIYDGKVNYSSKIEENDNNIAWIKDRKSFSPSSLESLGKCPFEFYLAQILNLRVFDVREERKNEWLNPSDRGTLMHAIIENFLNEIYPDDKEIDLGTFKEEDFEHEGRFYTRIMEIAEQQLEKQKKRLRPENEHIFKKEREDILERCGIFLEQEWGLINKCREKNLNIEKSLSEVEFNKEIILKEDKKLPLKGYIDRVLQFSNKEAEVIDYKTGSSKPSKGSPYKENSLDGGRKLQAPLYGLAYEGTSEGKISVTKTGYIFINTKTDEEKQIINDMNETRDNTTSILEGLYQIIKNGEFVVTDNEEDCEYCDFKSACSRELLENIDKKREGTYSNEVREFE
ncbi:PD-(D/E)XK nuclease family protein [Natranaerofaba carboxydovora]|uniref:PD-(D/E)XK nuclease family protein n=1 Tax=Natranaerofaba carboxydovora TaxID=2742683 RepID=UPI001F140F0E|nr:PD-(D/E)XK nuclease family protein [Natranaerofaba carboxydovora]UMZ72996.1 PD-(D/E)XK nuclease superfamily protein [Natranaerofaba carboxydovora]